MKQFEELQLLNGPIMVPNSLCHSKLISNQHSSLARQPSSRGGYRFGQLSMNSFFTRHNPHPQRVRHMKGLLDVPICTVIDCTNSQMTHGQTPLNVNYTLTPPSIISDIERFRGLKSFYKEMVLPKYGPLALMENWNKEIQNFTNQLGLIQNQNSNNQVSNKTPDKRPRTGANMYSSETGRLIPPPSRAMSRQRTRLSQKELLLNQIMESSNQNEMENTVLSMLCQILQTDDVNAVQGWLVCASDKERNLVSDLIRAAIISQTNGNIKFQEWSEQGHQPAHTLPPIRENTAVTDIKFNENRQKENKKTVSKIDRLILETPRSNTNKRLLDGHELKRPESCRMVRDSAITKISGVNELNDKFVIDEIKVPEIEPFSNQQRPLQTGKQTSLSNKFDQGNHRKNLTQTMPNTNSDIKLMYSKISHGSKESISKVANDLKEWNQENSIDKHNI